MANRMSDEEIANRLADMPEWRLEEKTVWRRFRFRTFRLAMQFTNAVADVAEARNHHPFITVDFKLVTLRLTSWHAGGLTADDFDEAMAFDTLYADMTQTDSPETDLSKTDLSEADLPDQV